MLRPGDIMSLVDMHSEAIGTQPMAELDREMTPILAELVTLGIENNEHPTVKKLFNWLVAPERTGEEFYYVTGPLQQYVSTVMMKLFVKYVDMGYLGMYGKYLCKVAAEALAVTCPILEGPWEQAAWILLKESRSYSTDDYGLASDRLTAWIINVIGNPVLCPNPNLRIELISLLSIVELENHKSLQPQAVESVLFACSSLNIDYLLESKPQHGFYHQMDIGNIIDTLHSITDDMDPEFDAPLAKTLKKVKTLRISAYIHDVACHYALNSNQFEEPQALHGVFAILKTISCFVRLNYKDYKENNSNLNSPNTGIHFTTSCLNDFICLLQKSCWTPHLIGLIIDCILTTMEIVLSGHAINERRDSFHNIGMMLIYLFDENLFTPEVESPENMITMLKYRERLNHLKINYC